MKKIALLSFVVTFALQLLLPVAWAQMSAGGTHTKTAVAESGVRTLVAQPHSMEMAGKPTPPLSVKPLTNPKHGTISFVKEGNNKTKIFYQSKKGYTGEDSFQFVRVANDVGDGTYTVIVTVR